MKTIIFIVVAFVFISCKNKPVSKVKQQPISKTDISTLANESLTNTSFSTKKTEKTQIEFLNFIDESLVFQEAIINDNSAYAFVCHGDEKEIKFSGKIYLKPSLLELNNWIDSNYREAIIDSINNVFSNREIHERFVLWAQITHKDFFMPYNELIDNPCENYKEDRTVIIYKSDKGQERWKEIEKTKNIERIEEILK